MGLEEEGGILLALRNGHQLCSEFVRGLLDVHFVSPTPVPSWERWAPARLQKPRWSVAFPGKAHEDWQCIYETDI
jgi:hypothetical protein